MLAKDILTVTNNNEYSSITIQLPDGSGAVLDAPRFSVRGEVLTRLKELLEKEN